MQITSSNALLSGLSPAAFMRRYWQRKPLLVRGAMPAVQPPLARAALLKMASQPDVESRLVVRQGSQWQVRQGPMPRSALPPLGQRDWTLLVQGLDLHVPEAHRLLQLFRFIPDARLDDVMMSWASDGGGVGPHLDSYDVFLLQVQGRRRWRIGPVADAAFREDLPLKVLRNFDPDEEWLLEPGDMLYLPPRWGHEGIAEGECMTCSIGFRAPTPGALAGDLLQRMGEGLDDADGRHYRDAGEPATSTPGAIAPRLQAFARRAVQRVLNAPLTLHRALGESLTEPKARVWFAPAAVAGTVAGLGSENGVVLDRATRMLYDDQHVFINGESFCAAGRDAHVLRALADQRCLSQIECRRLSKQAAALVAEWLSSGWLHGGAG